MPCFNWTALEENPQERGKKSDCKILLKEPTVQELHALGESLEKPFAEPLFLWKKTKDDLVEEMSTALQVPGWGNSFTQPIAAGSRCSRRACAYRSP